MSDTLTLALIGSVISLVVAVIGLFCGRWMLMAAVDVDGGGGLTAVEMVKHTAKG